MVRALVSHQSGPGSILRVVVTYRLSLFNAGVSPRQRDSKRVLPILPTTSQLLCQKNFARANDPAGNAGWFFSNYFGFRLSSKNNFQLELELTHKKFERVLRNS